MNEDQTGLHFMKIPVWHSGNIEWKQDIEELAQFYMQCLEQVIVFLISEVLANQIPTGKVFFVA